MDLGKTILVWRFYDAPKELQNLSSHGGDEDWLAFVPQTICNDDTVYLGWLESGSPFGCCDVSQHEYEGGRIYIGAHA
jgi:hypothetical protein